MESLRLLNLYNADLIAEHAVGSRLLLLPDLARLEILLAFGGVYLDADTGTAPLLVSFVWWCVHGLIMRAQSVCVLWIRWLMRSKARATPASSPQHFE